MKTNPTLLGVGAGILGTVLVAVVIWLTVVYTGAYNVAASDPHADLVRWSFDTTMHRSIANRAGNAEVPDQPSDELLAMGAGHYAGSCAYCHGAPGQEPAEWSRGMRPRPPHLVEAAKEWTPQELHWIIANGIKMTGMPAFGPHHSAEDITAIAAFVGALPGLSADEYRSLADQEPGDAPAGDSAGSDH